MISGVSPLFNDPITAIVIDRFEWTAL